MGKRRPRFKVGQYVTLDLYASGRVHGGHICNMVEIEDIYLYDVEFPALPGDYSGTTVSIIRVDEMNLETGERIGCEGEAIFS